ncbi:uncharacterized protein BX664DRAFT_332074 [Halteromyces radiatus]|uniref:uncharacterized protein n=1 Tax=Halteromyces radiatus TaxID=101107 RepID=UPI00221E541A|nr:uncharacterized protein BX664DRAFT_332074 [Halteromyces radiatus]KAI8089060.1 hypothetical protein BX664DRAFT_332074 [Halteromyces radiatus]
MQDLISYLVVTEKVCLVVIDFAGLSTNVDDLRSLIENHKNLQRIIVDHLPYEIEVKIYERDLLLSDPSALEAFSCRKGFYKRSK